MLQVTCVFFRTRIIYDFLSVNSITVLEKNASFTECSYLDNELQVQCVVLFFSVLYLFFSDILNVCISFLLDIMRNSTGFQLLSKRSLSDRIALSVSACFIHFNILR